MEMAIKQTNKQKGKVAGFGAARRGLSSWRSESFLGYYLQSLYWRQMLSGKHGPWRGKDSG